jgi:eukaryotic-like serine/threonine-protein kinase
VNVDEGDRVCARVTVTRDGKSGTPSAESCIDVEVVIE